MSVEFKRTPPMTVFMLFLLPEVRLVVLSMSQGINRDNCVRFSSKESHNWSLTMTIIILVSVDRRAVNLLMSFVGP